MTAQLPGARFWDRIADKYAANPIKDMAGYERSLSRIRHYLRPTDHLLEIGCGSGTTALKLAPAVASVLATDLSGRMIEIARGKAAAEGQNNVTFEVATPEDADWAGRGFDVALGMNILHLIERRREALQSVHRALRPGGLFITKTPCLKETNPLIRLAVPVMRLFGKAPYVAFLSTAEVIRDIEAAGFEVVEAQRHASGRRDARPFIVARKG